MTLKYALGGDNVKLDVSVIPTTRCNRNCWFCMFGSCPYGVDMSMRSTKKSAKVLKELKSIYPNLSLDIVMTGGGEMLLLDDLAERSKIYDRTAPEILRMITSGVANDEEAQKFVDFQCSVRKSERYSIMISVHDNPNSLNRLRKTLETDPYYMAVTVRTPRLGAWQIETQMKKVVDVIKEFGYRDHLWYGDGPVASYLGNLLRDEEDFGVDDLEDHDPPHLFYGVSKLVNYQTNASILVSHGEIGAIGNAIGRSAHLYDPGVRCNLFCNDADAYVRFEPTGFRLCHRGIIYPYRQLTADFLTKSFGDIDSLKSRFRCNALSGLTREEACVACPLYGEKNTVRVA